HWSIANEQQSKPHALFLQLCYRLEEQQVSLLLSQSRDTDQTRVVGNAVSSGLQQVLAQAAVNHLHLFPVLDSAPPKQLASTEVADCNHEGGALDLFANGQLFRAVELLRPMHGEAVRQPRDLMAEHRHHRGIGAEVGVEVLSPTLSNPTSERASLAKIDQISQRRSRRGQTQANRQAQRPQGPEGSGNQAQQGMAENPQRSGFEDRPGARALGDVRLVGKRGPGSANRVSENLHPLLLQRGDLAPNEAVTRAGVLVDKISDPQTRFTV